MRWTLLVVGISLTASAFQAQADFSGAWIIANRQQDGDTYGELRVVRQGADAIRVSMIDYATAWVGGAFRPVVRIMPWTFTLNEWAPRRGGAASRQPRARARHEGEALILEKSTDSGNGNFRWTWRVDAGSRLLHHEEARPANDVTEFHRMADGVAALATLDAIGNIHVRPALDRGVLQITCPVGDCSVIQFQSGIQVGVRKLPRAETTEIALDSEVRIEPLIVK
jgi:hypothetical protein